MIAERAGELSRRSQVRDSVVVSVVEGTIQAGKGIYFYCLRKVPTPSDLLQRFDSRKIPSIPDDPDIALLLQSS